MHAVRSASNPGRPREPKAQRRDRRRNQPVESLPSLPRHEKRARGSGRVDGFEPMRLGILHNFDSCDRRGIALNLTWPRISCDLFGMPPAGRAIFSEAFFSEAFRKGARGILASRPLKKLVRALGVPPAELLEGKERR